MKWWVDTSYAMHPDCRIHTGAKISLGWISVARMSKILKLNSRSSTEAELIREYDVLPSFLFSIYFIETN